MQPLIDSCADRLSKDQIGLVPELLCKNEIAFSRSKEELGECDFEMHRIDTDSAKPIKMPHVECPRPRELLFRLKLKN